MSIKHKYENTVLVTGAHRSGSTWLGQMLSLGQDTAYIHEPFNIGLDKVKQNSCPLVATFEYISTKHWDKRQNEIKEYLDRADKNLTQHSNNSGVSKNLIIKDPIALMSAEWFDEVYDSKVVVLIRHPAAFAASLKIKNWGFDFRNFRNQKKLLNNVLFPFRKEIEAYCDHPQPIIDQAILLWNIFYYRVKLYQLYNKNWIFVRHEDLSRNPVQEIKKLYGQLGLAYNKEVEAKILEAVQPKNTTEFKRDSKANIFSWMDRLTTAEIEKVKKKTALYSELFYEEKDWHTEASFKKQALALPMQLQNKTLHESNPKYNIESVNDKAIEGINELAVKEENLIIKGWAIDSTKEEVAKGVILKLGDKYFEAIYGYPRPDVAQFFKNKQLALCGFELTVATSQLEKGANPLTAYILGKDPSTYYRGNYNLKLLKNN